MLNILGCIFIDRVRDYNLVSGYPEYKIDISNPCVTGDTLILTSEGYKRIDSLIGQKVHIWNGFEWSKITPQITGHNQKMLRVTLSNGMSLDCTRYHKFIMHDGSRKEAKDLIKYDVLHYWKYPVIGGKIEIEDAYDKGYADIEVPTAEHTVDSRVAWFSGLLDSKGEHIEDDIFIPTKNAKEIQLMLTTLGTKSISMEEGILISEYDVCLLEESGLALKKLWLYRNPQKSADKIVLVTNIEEIEDAKTVYCFNEPINHSGIFNGIMTAQCAEYFGNDGNSCLLQSINLYNLVDNKFTADAKINYEKLKKLVRLSIKMMNQTQDYGYDMLPLDKNRKNVDDWRSIGLGIMGLADTFVALGVRYGSEESVKIAEDIAKTILLTALDESSEEAKKYGAYGSYNKEKQLKSPIINMIKIFDVQLYNKIEQYGLRNSSLISYAPTGSISLLLNKASSGIEPLFKIRYIRSSHQQEHSGKTFYVYSRCIEDLLNYYKLPLDISEEEIKKRFPFVIESHDIPWQERVNMQSTLQKYVDNAISSTVNLPTSSTIDDIFNIYISAYEKGCKGITIYRDGCKRGNILGVGNNTKEDVQIFKYDSIEPIKRRGVKEVSGKTFRMQTACSRLYITVNYTDDGDLFEIFTNITGGCAANINSLCRLTSAALRSGMKVSTIIEELKSVTCPACQALRKKGEKDIELSCGNAIAKALEKAYKDSGKSIVIEKGTKGLYECPQCHSVSMRLEAKCCVCESCGFSKCD